MSRTTWPGWYISTAGPINRGGNSLAGPFSTQDDAFAARRAIEHERGKSDLFVSEVTEPPAVVLPTVPTLGWVDLERNGRVLGHWQSLSPKRSRCVANPLFESKTHFDDDPIAFIPAVAVPADALNVLRKEMKRCLSFNHEMSSIEIFLAAVDEANRTDR